MRRNTILHDHIFKSETRIRNCVCIERTHASMHNDMKKSAFRIIYRIVKK